jgi:hypothetical protein
LRKSNWRNLTQCGAENEHLDYGQEIELEIPVVKRKVKLKFSGMGQTNVAEVDEDQAENYLRNSGEFGITVSRIN